MIIFSNLPDNEPYKNFLKLYTKAEKNNDPYIDIACVSSYNVAKKEVNARYVNLKYIQNEEWIFFSNYNSAKAQDFKRNPTISLNFYWSSTDTQIRLKGNVSQSSQKISDQHFSNRAINKNALSISSNQSSKIDSYETVIKNYEIAIKKDNLKKRPDYWGGYSFVPLYFEFWQGHESRINKREVFEYQDANWKKYLLEP